MIRPHWSFVCLLSAAALGCETRGSGPPPLEVATGYVTTSDGVRLWYRSVGGGPETVIVPNALFHGDRLDGLASTTRRLVLYDPRSRGRSDSVALDRISLDHQIADVEAIRRSTGADSVALIGWSGTGMELFAYALRHPTRVTRLVQLAPVAPRFTPYSDSMMASRQARTDAAASRALSARIDAGEFAGDEEGLCRAIARVTGPAAFGDRTKADLAPDVCIYPNEWPARIGPYFGALLGSMANWDWRPSLAQMKAPRLVIHGELDNTPLAGNKEWVEGVPDAKLVVIKGAGHWPHLERPEETLAAIRDFLDGKS